MRLSSRAVALTKSPRYELGELKAKVDELTDALAFTVRHGQRVLLKPNLVTAARGDGLAVTHPLVVRAVAEWCLDHGAAVAVGDSPAFGSGAAVMARCGITEALAGLPVRIAPFEQRQRVMTSGRIPVTLAAEVFGHDLLVNLPKLKAHGQMRVTMAVKNYFGVVVAWRKAMAHMRFGDNGRFERLVVDLLDLLPDGLSLIDGVMAMHRTGPIQGEPLAVGVLGASPNPVALDTAMLAVLGLAPESSPLWRECDRRRLPGSRLLELTFPLASPSTVAVSGFVAPERLDPVRFQGWRFLWNSVKKALK